MVGDAPVASAFIASFRDGATRGALPGAVYGDGYRELLAYAWVYVHATEVGGTHPALVEAMGYGTAWWSTTRRRTARWRATPGVSSMPRGRPASPRPGRLRRDPAEVGRRRRLAAAAARERYDWERVADGYAALLRRMSGRDGGL